MKSKLFILIAAVAIGASTLTVVVIRVHARLNAAKVRQQADPATTNMMRELKPLTAPPIFPETK
jgi:hypothetical protein